MPAACHPIVGAKVKDGQTNKLTVGACLDRGNIVQWSTELWSDFKCQDQFTVGFRLELEVPGFNQVAFRQRFPATHAFT